MNERFRQFAQWLSRATGHALAFILALLIVLVWLVTGPLFGFSNTWQLVINTGTTIITFLMVFILQNTQDRDNRAIQLKLDELLRAVKRARNAYIDIEEVPDKELESLAEEFREMHEGTEQEKQTRDKKREAPSDTRTQDAGSKSAGSAGK